MMDTKTLILNLANTVSVSGYEYMAENALREIVDGFGEGFCDDIRFDKFGGLQLTKNPGTDRKKILIDVHLDEIGMIVTGIFDGGFVKLQNIGGIDVNTLPGELVDIFIPDSSGSYNFSPDRKITGIISSIPPHLKAVNSAVALKINEFFVDTGYTKEKLESIVTIGCPAVLSAAPVELRNNLICARGMDNKACVAAALLALSRMNGDDPHVRVSISAGEETSSVGAKTSAYEFDPDFALVLDADFASVPEVEEAVSIKSGMGAGVSLSASTSIALSKRIIKMAKEIDIKCQTVAEPSSTGTNAHHIQLMRSGIPCAVIDIPLKNMHTRNEVVSIDDIEFAADLICAAVREIAK